MDGLVENKRRELDFKQCLLYVLDHCIVAIIVGVLFACLLSCYSYMNQKKNNDSEKTLKEIITRNKSAYYPNAGQVVKNTEKEEVPGTCNIRGDIYIDFDFKSIEGNSNLDYSSMVNKFQSDALSLFIRDTTIYKIADNINSSSYKNIKKSITADELRWLINLNFNGANILHYSVTDIDPDRALDIAKALNEIFIKENNSYEAFNSVKSLNEPSIFINNTNIEYKTNYSTIVKYSVVGFVLGIIFAFGIYFLLFILTDRIRTVKDLEYFGVDIYGVIPCKSKQRDNEYKRIAYNLIAKNESKKIFLIPADEKTKIDAIADNVSAILKDNNNNSEFIKSECVKQAPEAVLNAQKTDGIVLVATYGRTKMKDIDYSKNEMLKSGKDILGAIIVNSKHN